ncbi:integrase core domain-containing protein, partial [Methanosarcinaceae archaeon]|nr:integrase core domain-containing protein [Methanosarcinaceae archaeon]
SFKSEFANHEKFRSIKEAEDKIRQWINQYYNYDRLHSSIGYMPPGIYHYLNIRGLLCPRKVVYTISFLFLLSVSPFCFFFPFS